ncbi:hypothetical protein QE152_g890 [Popillia japonica]|uniref:Uncharacterized protein n=1 Tax=Popillia japonica TaxID=7064 RepID=A0AAW1NAB7_POPJA
MHLKEEQEAPATGTRLPPDYSTPIPPVMSGKVFGVVAGTLRLETVLDDGTHLSEPFYPGKRNKTELNTLKRLRKAKTKLEINMTSLEKERIRSRIGNISLAVTIISKRFPTVK